ncbi:MAG: NmrA family NAD(P)-binding protein [Trueperaceae bacterium]
MIASEGPVAVTGPTGNVGAEVVRELRAAGAPVRALGIDSDRARATLGNDLEHVRFAFGDEAGYAAAFRGARALFLMRPPQIADVARRIHPAIDAARAAGVRRIVFLSLQGVERNPVVPHHRIERHLRRSGVPSTMLRPSFFLQNLSTTHRDEIRDQGRIFVPAGRGRTSFVDARDVAAVAAKTLLEDGHEGRAYELTGREALGYAEVAEVLSEALGRPIAYANPSPLAFWRRSRAAGMPATFVLVMLGLYTAARLGMAARVTLELERLLGRPPISVRRFVEDHVGAWG